MEISYEWDALWAWKALQAFAATTMTDILQYEKPTEYESDRG